MEKTKAQSIMARFLRKEGLNVIENIYLPGGEADILLPDYKVIIELDGYFHLSSETQKNDQRKENIWIENGYQVFRFKNEEVYSKKSLCIKRITDHIFVMKGLVSGPLISPMKDQQILKNMHSKLLRQEQKAKGTRNIDDPKKNPEAYFLSLDLEKGPKKDDQNS